MKETQMTRDELLQILKRCEAATPSPWRSYVEGRDHDSGDSFIKAPGKDIYLSGASLADQDFIAATRQDLPRLVNELLKLKGW
jgi:hypothetical protein